MLWLDFFVCSNKVDSLSFFECSSKYFFLAVSSMYKSSLDEQGMLYSKQLYTSLSSFFSFDFTKRDLRVLISL